MSARKIDRVKKRFVEEGYEAALVRPPSQRVYDSKIDGELPNVPPDVAALLARLQTENAMLRAQIEAKDANLTDLRQSLRLLEYIPTKRRWWHFGQ